MDDPITGHGRPVWLRRVCERNRLEKEFLSHAYECLLAVVTVDDRHHDEQEWLRPLDFRMEGSTHSAIILGGTS